MRSRTLLTMALAAALLAGVLTASPASAAATYSTDAAGDQSSGGSAPLSMRREADIRKVATWVKDGRAYARAWLGDVSSRDTSVTWQGAINGVYFALTTRRGAVKPSLVVNYRSRCAGRGREGWSESANTVTMSIPVSCLPSGRVVKDGRYYAVASYRRSIPKAWASDEARLNDTRVR